MQDDTSSGDEPRSSAAKRLVAAVTSLDAELFHDQARRAFCLTPNEGAQLIGSAEFEQWAAGQFFRAYRSVIPQKALKDACATLTGMACFEAEQQSVYVRVAQHEGRHLIDLGDAALRCVIVDADGWRIEPHPVRFWRPDGLLPLPEPAPGGDVRQLLDFAHLAQCDLPLMVAWILEAYRADTPKPILELSGEHGTSKTSAQRAIVNLIDPQRAQLQLAPRNARDLAAAASGRWCLSFDNASHLAPDLQDQLCVLATGGTFAERRLYSNFGQASVSVLNPVVLNGIGGAVTRPDLLSRSVLLEMQPITATARLTDREFEQRLAAARPALFGALLDLLVKALQRLPELRLAGKPRMADFALLGEAVTEAMSWPVPFHELYAANQQEASVRVLEQYSVAQAVLQLLARTKDHCWEGRYGELHNRLAKPDGAGFRSWPETPKGLSQVLSRIAPSLRDLGVFLTRGSRDSSGRWVRLDGSKAGDALGEFE
jgi:hypothetical protein